MRLWLACWSITFACAALSLGTLPASATPAESQDNYLSTDINRLASALKAQSERAADAATRAVDDGQSALVGAKTRMADRLENFRDALNERKATLGMIGEDVVARFDAWKQETLVPWLDQWPDAWTETMSDMHRSASEAVSTFRDWLNKHFAPEEPAEIPV